MTRPRHSARITGLHRYHEAVRPCATHHYSGPCGFCRSDGSLSRQWTQSSISLCAVSRRRFPRSTPEPGSSSRHLHAGHRLASRQAPARLRHGPEFQARFRCRLSVSTRQQWFTRIRLLDPHLTHSRRAFSATLTTPALRPAQLAVVCGLPLQGDRGGPSGRSARPLHLRCSTASPNRAPTSIHLCVRGTRIPPLRWTRGC